MPTVDQSVAFNLPGERATREGQLRERLATRVASREEYLCSRQPRFRPLGRPLVVNDHAVVGGTESWRLSTQMPIPIPDGVRELLEAPNYVHLSTLRADGSPRNWVVWVGLEGENILICTSNAIWKAKDMLRDPRVALSVTDTDNPYRMAAIQGRVVEVRPDEGCRYMDPISYKYTSAPFPSRGADRVCFVIAVEKAALRSLAFTHSPA